jgi:hypothetical protein
MRYVRRRAMQSWELPIDPFIAGEEAGGWLFLSSISPRSSVVIDLSAWPSAPVHLAGEQILAAAPADGGWIVSSIALGAPRAPAAPDVVVRDGFTFTTIDLEPDPRARTRAVYRHEPGAPGRHAAAIVQPDDEIAGLARLGGRVVGFVESGAPLTFDGDRWSPLGSLPPAIVRRARGALELGDGTPVLIWNGDAYELRDDGTFAPPWELACRDVWRFSSAPWDRDGFYFVSQRRLFRVRRGRAPEAMLPKLDAIESVRPGPDGALVLSITPPTMAKTALVGALAYPDRAEYVPIRREDVGALRGERFASVHFARGQLLAVGQRRLVSIAAEQLRDRRPLKAGPPPRAPLDPRRDAIASKLDDGSADAMDEIAALARESGDPRLYEELLEGTVLRTQPPERVASWKRSAEIDLTPGPALRPTPKERLRRCGLARRLLAEAPAACTTLSALRASIDVLAIRAFDVDLRKKKGVLSAGVLIASADRVDLAPLAAFEGLRELSVDWRSEDERVSYAWVKLRGLEVLARMPALRVLRIGATEERWPDLSLLRGATALEVLELRHRVATLDGVAALTSLSTLHVYDSSFADLAPLAGHPRLADLALDVTEGGDLSALATLPSLARVSIRGRDLTLPALAAHVQVNVR